MGAPPRERSSRESFPDLEKKNSSIIGAPIGPETSYWSRTKEKLQTTIILVAPELWCIIKWLCSINLEKSEYTWWWIQRNLNTHGGGSREIQNYIHT